MPVIPKGQKVIQSKNNCSEEYWKLIVHTIYFLVIQWIKILATLTSILTYK